ncbi:MAG: hypothetical protein A2758_00050 [Candidatus Zambryskibacteria bacterium RIFCSPHIGHO2_01_FULL_49_18]|uniref:Uncharacterized protein n=2 Tax=Parcubacteria group TaxID=1794811 RepID=A0A1G2T559_9BACT|nr:MAG: hypothetical protein A2941_02355 [Candidatus Yanofskybacteria bacterium RIFCSPLOWO2_01_FULL_49_17]OHA91731.1 MAG: hypothetical protein A2758_00050 [Candidatus Zambryskibacteria bacterium RIFCSPHIGHO2_01_FULL_49_18]
MEEKLSSEEIFLEGQANKSTKPLSNLVWRKWHQLHDRLRVALDSTLPVGDLPNYGDFQVEDPIDDEGRSLPFAYALEMGLVEMEDMIYDGKSRERQWEKKNYQLNARFGTKFRDMETVDRHYHPRVGFAKGKVFFKVHIIKTNPEDKMPFKRITLWKRGIDRDFHTSMRCGRAGEEKPFGFEGTAYLPLAYPGKTGVFEPLLVRVSEYNNSVPFYIKITAHDEPDNIVVVEAKEVDPNEAPLFLRRG